MHIPLEKTLDVELVERELAELWKQTSGDAAGAGQVGPADDFAVLRARVANLIVYVANESMLAELHEIISELTAMHPSRVLLLLGERTATSRDIEISVDSCFQTDKRTGARRLSCEEITLKAGGEFIAELPSAALPLVISDLTTFLWWRDRLATGSEKREPTFDALLQASDRLVVDSAEFLDPASDLIALTEFFDDDDCSHLGISDLNWARLTSWRSLLAGFYDVAAHRSTLARIDRVRIDYIAPEPSLNESGQDSGAPSSAVAPQALLIAGWLASRLGWALTDDGRNDGQNDEAADTSADLLTFVFNDARPGTADDRGSSPTVREGVAARSIKLELNRVEQPAGKPGRLVSVSLESTAAPRASFIVSRSADNLHLIAEARVRADVQRGRVVPVRNRSAAQLLGREMEILCNDQIYQEAVAMAARMIGRVGSGPSS